MSTRAVTSPAISDEMKAAINELVADSGAEYEGVDDNQYLLLKTRTESPESADTLAREILKLIVESDDPFIKTVRGVTRGISLKWL